MITQKMRDILSTEIIEDGEIVPIEIDLASVSHFETGWKMFLHSIDHGLRDILPCNLMFVGENKYTLANNDTIEELKRFFEGKITVSTYTRKEPDGPTLTYKIYHINHSI